MSAKPISQREARRLQKRVTELEHREGQRRRIWGQDWPGGVQIASHTFVGAVPDVIRTARKLGHAVVAVSNESTEIRFVALPHPKDDL